MTTQLTKKLTVGELVAAYRSAEREIRDSFALLGQAEARLNDAFTLGDCGHIYIRTRWNVIDHKDVEDTVDQIKRQCWGMLVERLDIRRCLSIERAAALDRQLEKEELPDITIENVQSFAQGYLDTLPEMLQESVAEVFEWLRPRQLRYKTDSVFELQDRAIARSVIDTTWRQLPHTRWRVCHYYTKNLTALENVFTALDGKGMMTRNYLSDLHMAIEKAPAESGRGETPYFEFRACRNGNLHLRFKRADLLARFNALAGGKRLKTNLKDDAA